MKKLFITILSWLLYHANRKPNKEFYEIKNRILEKYGTHICYDIQHFQGVKCDTCNGTGIFKCSWKFPETCWSCTGTGWYKPESWVILARIRFGKYSCFHQPLHRIYERPDFTDQMIEGYVEKKPTRYSHFARGILFLICEKGYLKRWYRETGNYWRVKWWIPQNWVHNLIYILRHRASSFPLRRLQRKLEPLKFKKAMATMPAPDSDDDLPF